jgi:hypothetical protein
VVYELVDPGKEEVGLVAKIALQRPADLGLVLFKAAAEVRNLLR